MYVDLEEQLCVEGDHVEDVVEEGGEDGDADVDDAEEEEHLEGAPQRFQKLPHQHDHRHVQHHLPEVHLQEAEEGRVGRLSLMIWINLQ